MKWIGKKRLDFVRNTLTHTPVRSHTRRKKMSVNLWHILNALTTYKITSFICQHRSLLKRVAFWIISNLALYYSCTDNLLFSTSSSALCFSHRFSPIIMRYYCCDFNCVFRNCTVQSTNANVHLRERKRRSVYVCTIVQPWLDGNNRSEYSNALRSSHQFSITSQEIWKLKCRTMHKSLGSS